MKSQRSRLPAGRLIYSGFAGMYKNALRGYAIFKPPRTDKYQREHGKDHQRAAAQSKSAAKKVQKEFGVNFSAMQNLEGDGVTRSFINDPMHCLIEGVGKKFLIELLERNIITPDLRRMIEDELKLLRSQIPRDCMLPGLTDT